MSLRPLQDRVLLKRLDPEAVSKGGIIIPETAKEKPLQAIVVAIGEGRILDNGERAPIDCAVGDTVIVGKYSGTEVTIAGEKLVVAKYDDIVAVVESEPTPPTQD